MCQSNFCVKSSSVVGNTEHPAFLRRNACTTGPQAPSHQEAAGGNRGGHRRASKNIHNDGDYHSNSPKTDKNCDVGGTVENDQCSCESLETTEKDVLEERQLIQVRRKGKEHAKKGWWRSNCGVGRRRGRRK